jgi:hypothetical protein
LDLEEERREEIRKTEKDMIIVLEEDWKGGIVDKDEDEDGEEYELPNLEKKKWEMTDKTVITKVKWQELIYRQSSLSCRGGCGRMTQSTVIGEVVISVVECTSYKEKIY